MVTHKSVEVGQIVQPGQGLMTIIPLHDTWVTANFKETQLARRACPASGRRSTWTCTADSVDGHVDSIAGATGSRMSLLPPENATGNFVKVVQRIPVKILVDQREGIDPAAGHECGRHHLHKVGLMTLVAQVPGLRPAKAFPTGFVRN